MPFNACRERLPLPVHAQDLHGSGHGTTLQAPLTFTLLPFHNHALYRAAAALGAPAVRRKLESGQEIKTRCKAKTATRRQLDLADTGGKLAKRSSIHNMSSVSLFSTGSLGLKLMFCGQSMPTPKLLGDHYGKPRQKLLCTL